MRKLFIKCSDERSRRFSIITTIAETEEGKRVFKEACYPEGQEHLARIASYAELIGKAYAPAKACPVSYDGEKLTFAYLTGESLEKKLRDAVRAGDAELVKDLFLRQKRILTANKANDTAFVPSDDFMEWFGDDAPYAGQAGFRISNFDGTAGNIIFEGDDVFFIDYEWVMTFVMPRDLVLFHCLRDAYYHISDLEGLVPLRDALRCIGVRTDPHVLQRSYEHFFGRVISEPDGRSFATAKRSALKEHTELSELRGRKAPAEDSGTAYDMWRECDRAVAVLQRRIGLLEAELAAEKKKYAELDYAWFARWDEIRGKAELAKAQYDEQYAHYMKAYEAMETDRNTWKRMYEDVTGSKTFKAVQTVKNIGRKKG